MLIVNKMDCLVFELKLLFNDVYYKFKYVIEEVNIVIENMIFGKGELKRVSLERGNVLFVCILMGWCFILKLFVKMYFDSFGGVNVEEFVKWLWGDVYFNLWKWSFIRKFVDEGVKWFFVNFIFEFIYKIYFYIISESLEDFKGIFVKFGI